MDYEEFSKYREITNLSLRDLYTKLMSVPSEAPLKLTRELRSAINDLYSILPSPSAEVIWIVQLHAAELSENFGGLSMIQKSFLPLGVLTMMRQKKVTWQMVL
jgi:hypothetical protein